MLWPCFPELVRLVLCVSTMCPFFVRRHVPALRQLRSTMWTLSACGLLWGRAMASWSKVFSLGIAGYTALILHARWSVLAPQIRPLRAHPMLEKLFGVYYAGIIGIAADFQNPQLRPCAVVKQSNDLSASNGSKITNNFRRRPLVLCQKSQPFLRVYLWNNQPPTNPKEHGPTQNLNLSTQLTGLVLAGAAARSGKTHGAWGRRVVESSLDRRSFANLASLLLQALSTSCIRRASRYSTEKRLSAFLQPNFLRGSHKSKGQNDQQT